jgi:nucleoside-diphosphate-sugar epimerase
MRAFVTGATGFLGSFLTRHLVEAGVQVTILRRPGSDPWRIAPLLSTVTDLQGSLLDLDPLEPVLRKSHPDVVFHLAWQGVANHERNDEAQIDHNLASGLALFRLAGRLGCRAWVGLGSQAEYGPQNKVLAEDAPTRPMTLYGAAKLAAYHLLGALARQSRTRFVWVRVFSAYGPGDHSHWMIPSLIQQLLEGKRPALTAGEQRWDFIHAQDVADALWRLGSCPAAEGVFNLGSGQAPTLRSTIETIRDLVHPGLPLGFGEIAYRPDQVMHLQADIGKLSNTTGWRPRISLCKGLSQTVAWYRERANSATVTKETNGPSIAGAGAAQPGRSLAEVP